jgi:hypothetical protein
VCVTRLTWGRCRVSGHSPTSRAGSRDIGQQPGLSPSPLIYTFNQSPLRLVTSEKWLRARSSGAPSTTSPPTLAFATFAPTAAVLDDIMLETTIDAGAPSTACQPADEEPAPLDSATESNDAATFIPAWAPCTRSDCPCTASWNGQPGQHCGEACCKEKPCSRNFHPRPRPTAARPQSSALRPAATAFVPSPSPPTTSISLVSCIRCHLLLRPRR